MSGGSAAAHPRVVIEADGGSRGNPGDAAYGAVLFDAATGEAIAERAECIGVATNNVAEYRGLIAGLELYNEHTPEAELEVRMDSKLVVEQMSGRWKIKHPDMKPLAMAASRLAPPATTYTWIPREKNKYADRILNEALDTQAGKPVKRAAPPAAASEQAPPRLGWSGDPGTPTTLILVRHGETEHTREKRFSGHGGDDPGLNADGRAQVRATAEWLAPLAEEIDVVVSSPLRRTRETAEIVAEILGHRAEVEDGLAEAAFGTWDGLTFAEVKDRHPDDLEAWLGGLDVAPTGGGESFQAVDRRVRRTRDRLIAAHPGKTVLAVSHVTPIKILVRLALDAPLESLFRMELAPASVTVISWYADGRASMRMFNARPMETAFLGR
ncbi:bifunctional RNase H/acid phosphatase [Nocardioides mesophilus]|uniref:Bifunctional RNase H/acid phosphatase n=1 Tax=Nocardioides mesophilus TaxID=433659 RepID=A0A7G9RCE5_9ACTN|nr:bifunctional RNase H/acid phosphatase [Nocardioides mesophilus]QNN53270.1 bifunctional RNase H/acid phosphatase [Nocardioides mesophilus]